MPVEDVNVPPRVRVEDVKNAKPMNESDATYWEKQKEKVRQRREFMEEQKALETIENPPAQESPFKVTGEFNLGKVDLQEQQKQAKEEAERVRQESAAAQKDLAAKLEASQKETADLKMTAALKEISKEFSAVLSAMNQKIDAVAKGADPAGMVGYIDMLEKLAGRLGYSRGETGGIAGIGDPRLAIELQKMRAEEAARERAFQLQMEQFRFEISRQIKKDEREDQLKKEELEAKKKRDELFAKAPEILGQAIGRGMMEGGGGGQPAAVQAPVSTRPPIQQQTPQQQQYVITATVGEAGEIDCPDCQQPISIGPTSTTALCASCDRKVAVKRVEADASV